MKRVVDVVFATAILVVFGLPIMIIAVLVRLNLGGPVLFRQVRPGLRGEPFELIKFRTMLNAFDADGRPLPDADRLTPFGNFLRASSLDELPEFWNVLKGEMTLVGPRPLLVEYLPHYSPNQARRHDVKPGITGWAQVNGRNALTWDEKFRLDVWYVDNYSLWLDFKILAMTLAVPFHRRGISAPGHATMPPFE